MDYRGKRITVMGLGTRGGGAGVVRYLVAQGALVTVTDLRSGDQLSAPLDALAGLPIRYVLGAHDPAEFSPVNADMIVRNPAVPRQAPMLKVARAAGLPIQMEMSLFLSDCPAPVIGITGTKGKTSTASICAEMLRQLDAATILAGNMGVSAVGELHRITPETPVVVEISNWQLEGTAEHRLSPAIAVLTNISEDHLNTYRNFAEYAAIKRSIGHHLKPGDWLVVNMDDPEARLGASETAGQVAGFGVGRRDAVGGWVETGALHLHHDTHVWQIPWPENPAVALPVQRLNAAAAAVAALLRGATPGQIARGMESFRGVPHRMEHVGTVAGVVFVNDTAATAPAAAIASLTGYLDRTVHLIAGGADKGLNTMPLAKAICDRAASLVLLDGNATAALAAQLRECGVEPVAIVSSMAEAVAVAVSRAVAGDIVLLAPGCASFGLFLDEFDRGEQFRSEVHRLVQREMNNA